MHETTNRWIRSICPYYGVGCGFLAGIDGDRGVAIEYLTDHPVTEGALCPKGNAALQTIRHPDRLLHPLKKVDGDFQKISWEQAFSEISERLLAIRQSHGAGNTAFLSS